jgi:hypothetical protein
LTYRLWDKGELGSYLHLLLSVHPRLRRPWTQWLRGYILRPIIPGVNDSPAICELWDLALFFWTSMILSLKWGLYYIYLRVIGKIKWILIYKLITTCLTHCRVINKWQYVYYSS